MHRLLATLAGTALAVLAAAVPAQAAPAAGFDLKLKAVTLAPGGGQDVYGLLSSTRPAEVTGASANLEITGDVGNVNLAGNGTPGPCDQTFQKTLHCQIQDLTVPAGAVGASLGWAGAIVAGTDVVPGATGTLTVTFKANGIAPITRSVPIRIGTAADLVAGPTVDRSVAPGGTFSVPLVVSAAGPAAIVNPAVVVGTQDAYESTTRFKNCRYDGPRLRACTFAQTLEPGASYRAVLPMRLRRDTFAPETWYGSANWQTAAEFADLDAFLTDGSLGKPGTGTGAVLTLERVLTAKAAPVQGDPDTNNNYQFITVKSLGTNGLNLVAVGARLTGKAGSTVVAKVGVRNAGPAALDMTNHYRSLLLAVDIPAGSDAASIPRNCAPLIDGRLDIQTNGGTLGYREYWCETSQKLAVGQTQIFPIGLRITKVIASATGAIEINKKGSGADQGLFTADRPKTDNKSAIVLNAPGKPSGGGSGGNGGSDNGNGDNGDGGGLPITGPQSLAIGGSGLLILLAGAGAVLLVRRRRTRFES